jgi:CTP:molybdopterin cytidylyltransferase MocA
MLYPVDYPLLDRGIVRKLAAAYKKKSMVVVPSFQGRAGHPVILSPRLREELAAARTAQDVVYRDRRRVTFVRVGTAAIWKDIDTPAAYRRRLGEFPSPRRRR